MNRSPAPGVKVTASGPDMPERTLSPRAGSNPDAVCNSNCAAMVGVVSNAAGTDAVYWTVSDALC